MMELLDMCKKAIKHWGKETQIDKAKEELAELYRELTLKIGGYKNDDRILEELADVYNMIEQIKMIFGFSNFQIRKERIRKMERTMERIESETKKAEKDENV